MGELVKWNETDLEAHFEKNVGTIEEAIELGQQLKGVGERCEITIGLLANHVEKGKWGGGITAFAKGIGIPRSTVMGWMKATSTPELVARATNLGTRKVEVIERAPDPEEVWERVDAQEEVPTVKEIKKIVKEQTIVLKDTMTPIQLRLFNTWNFSEALHGNPKYGWGYNTGHITENLLYYYTEPDDLVIDPMVGSGTTIGACKRMKRRCLALDKEDNILDGIKTDELAQFVFLDPPFYTLLQNEFKDYDDFLDFVRKAVAESIKVVKQGGFIALIMKNLSESEDNPKRAMIGDCYEILKKHKELEFENMILCPLSTQRSGTGRAKERKELLNNTRVVWVFRML